MDPKHFPLQQATPNRQGHLSFGGVGRNVAWPTWSLLDSDRLLTAFGEDYRAQAQRGLPDCGIDIDASITVPGALISTYPHHGSARGDAQEAVTRRRRFIDMSPRAHRGAPGCYPARRSLRD